MPDASPSPRPSPSRWIWRGLLACGVLAAIALFAAWWLMIRMPGQSYRDEAPPLDDDAADLRRELLRHVETLAERIGERNLARYPQLQQAADYIADELAAAGYDVARQEFPARGHTFVNLEAELLGASQLDEIVVVGAHYDTVPGSPGAGDNASGVATLLALARRLAEAKPARTVRFVAFANEEAPYFQSDEMGSWVYARRCRKRNQNIVAMLSLETMGYFRDEPGTQLYPAPLGAFYPSEGNFIGVIGNVASRPLVHRVIEVFRQRGRIPSEGGALPGEMIGVGWSDHWSFWQEGYPAVMITDTAFFRYPYYHRPDDTPDKLSYDKMARVAEGLEAVIRDLASGG